jgi:hypothetical protein
LIASSDRYSDVGACLQAIAFDRQQAGSYKKPGWPVQTLIASSDRSPNVGACLQAMAFDRQQAGAYKNQAGTCKPSDGAGA